LKLLIKVAYLGTNYCGYQVQPNGVTVQQQLNLAARALFGCECDIVGCSRTDSGVHARAFSATVAEKGKNCLRSTVPVERVPRAMNVHLPFDIAVTSAAWVEDDFHARYDVISKEYEYLIYNAPVRDPFWQDRAWHVPEPIGEAALSSMQEAAAAFVGKQDFAAFCAAGSDVADTVRTVLSTKVERRGDMISFRVRADGFLYNMVRIMTGTLLEVGRGRLSTDDVKEAIISRDRRRAGKTAPACGLYLDRVFYE